MRADDPRHGTERGHEQHKRDGETPCAACIEGDLKAGRRRSKRKTQGFLYTLPAGAAHDRLVRWRDGSASYADLSIHTGVEESVIVRTLSGGRDSSVYIRTWRSIMDAPATMPLTSIGTTRRIQALQCMGWSVERIAVEAGVHRDTILDGRKPREFVGRRVRHSVAEAYERLHMTIPTGETRSHRAGITRARNYAARQGWVPPLGWDDIDDILERPTREQGGEIDRREALTELDDMHAGISHVCHRLGMQQRSLERWCEREGMRDLYARLCERERRAA